MGRLIEMRLPEFVLVVIISALAISSASATDGVGNISMEIDINASLMNQSESRFYLDRSNFETNLIHHVPAPQNYRNETPPAGVEEILYHSGDLLLKAWISADPADGKKHPAVVYAHGGFSFGGADEWAMMQQFLDQGFVLMAPMLRGENGNPGYFEFFYGEVDDLIAAGDYLANVSYVDEERIFLCGHSVGGTLSMLVSMMPSKYRAHASYSGSPDQELFFLSFDRIIPFDSNNPEEIALRSPIEYPDSIIKPLFVYVAEEDIGYVELNEYLADYAREIGRPCEFRIVRGDHFSSVGESVRLTIDEFEDIEAYEVRAINRSMASVWFFEGMEYYNLTRYEEAIYCYDRAIEFDPLYALAWNGKGCALAEMGLYNESIEYFDHAILIDEDLAMAWENKAIALDALGRYAESNAAYRKAVSLY